MKNANQQFGDQQFEDDQFEDQQFEDQHFQIINMKDAGFGRGFSFGFVSGIIPIVNWLVFLTAIPTCIAMILINQCLQNERSVGAFFLGVFVGLILGIIILQSFLFMITYQPTS